VAKKKKQPLTCQSLTIGDSLEGLNSSKDGLSSREAEKRLEKNGRNELPGKKKVRLWKVIIEQLKSPLIYILIAAGVISSIVGEIKDAVFIFFIILLNTSLGTYQEWRAEKSAESMQEYLKIKARVIRDGQEKSIDAEELVPGDIVLLRSGEKVPADLRLLKTKNLSIDESLLTGESVSVDKTNRKEKEDTGVSDCQNLAFAGTRVTSGRSTAMVTKTGLDTEIGKIAEEVQSEEEVKPPLLIRMDKFAKQIGLVVLGGIVVLAVIAISQGYEYMEIFLLSVALAVSAIPAGLPVAVTVALSISSNRMSSRNVIIRKLAAVESLGSCTLIASDKTGTLTVNRQTAKKLIIQPGRIFKVSGEGYNDKGQVLEEDESSISKKERQYLERVARATVLDNEASLKKAGDSWEYEGNPIDIAFLSLSYKLGLDPNKIRGDAEIVGEIPFESENKFSAKFYRGKSSNRVASKGAPEVIIPMCRKMHRSGKFVDIDEDELKARANELAGNGYRVIAVADGRAKKKKDYESLSKKDLPGLNLLALVGFIDPIRSDAADAIKKSKDAGVKVVMVTGDNAQTALNIARELKITEKEDEVITGSELGEDPEDDEEKEKFENMARSKKVFARIAPIQKLKLVEVFKKIGNYVAVTGDGVNDTPALKRANIGVAMGSGTDVTKDTASIIITDDSFSSIVAGIEEGRFAYDNIRKVTYLLISTGAAEVILFIAALLAGLPLALVAIQLLWLNLVTNGIQDVALAFEKGEPGAMKRKPRDPSEGIFNRQMLEQVAISGIVMGGITLGTWYYLINNGWETGQARNLLLLLMVLLQNFHVFNCRSETTSAFRVPISRNYLLMGGVIAAQGIHIGSMYIPFMQDLLGISPVSFREWGIMMGIAFSIIVVMEIFKLIKRLFPDKGQ
jgi:magnesium-transporting ATPase (P-type)